jgi:hypothetical protein
LPVEQDAGSKGSFESKPATPPPPPAVDEEKVALRQQLETAQGHLKQLGDMVQRGDLVVAKKDTPPVEEDDTALVDRKELKKHLQTMEGMVAGAITQQTALNANLNRETAIELMKGSLPDLEEHRAEIVALLDKMDPRVAAQPNTIRQAYKLVASSHLDEKKSKMEKEIEARVKAELRAQGVEVPDEDEGGDVEVSEAPERAGRVQAALPSRPSSGVAPVGDGSSNRTMVSRRDVNIKPLSRDERTAANLFGIKDAAEYRRLADRTWKPDMMGSKGRTKF